MGVLCWYSKSWFWSFVLLMFIITQIGNVVGFTIDFKGFVGMLLLQIVAVKGIDIIYGKDCTAQEIERLTKKI